MYVNLEENETVQPSKRNDSQLVPWIGLFAIFAFIGGGVFFYHLNDTAAEFVVGAPAGDEVSVGKLGSIQPLFRTVCIDDDAAVEPWLQKLGLTGGCAAVLNTHLSCDHTWSVVDNEAKDTVRETCPVSCGVCDENNPCDMSPGTCGFFLSYGWSCEAMIEDFNYDCTGCCDSKVAAPDAPRPLVNPKNSHTTVPHPATYHLPQHRIETAVGDEESNQ